ncbi:MAG TPA: S8/S53 family peptidase [Saprospiraceae bacterium]|nr:S8/S53 family peptidase [Saprospiraceae bacterium]HMP25766.1 S8/S53 family peptidase [Saprospiraceae bacterium]
MLNVKYFLFVACLLLSVLSVAQTPLPGQIILHLQPGAAPHEVLRQLTARRAAVPTDYTLHALGNSSQFYLLALESNSADEATVLAALRQMPQIKAAQFDYQLEARQTPDDPDFERQWGAVRIGAPEVWALTPGGLTPQGDTIVIAILDLGYDVAHEDLAANIWRNLGEIPDDGIDNDGNGYVDDINGWSFFNNSNQHPIDQHGTSVSGIIGAVGNNGRGVAGINWNVKMMLFSVDRVSHIIAAYEYIIEQRRSYNLSGGQRGAFVVATNLSLGVDRQFCSEQPVWGSMYNLLGEVGVLTGAATANRAWNVDEVGDMPTTCDSEFLISCLNTNANDELHSGSAYGAKSIQLGVPGQNSYTTKTNNRYGSFNDNSAAAPHLTGAIALLYGLPCAELTANALDQPVETARIIRDAIINGVEPLDALQGRTATGGRLNVARSMQQLLQYCTPNAAPLALVQVYPNPADVELIITYDTEVTEPHDLWVFNALGQMVYQQRFTPPQFGIRKQKINISNWQSGVYFLILQQGKRRVQSKFLVH